MQRVMVSKEVVLGIGDIAETEGYASFLDLLSEKVLGHREGTDIEYMLMASNQGDTVTLRVHVWDWRD